MRRSTARGESCWSSELDQARLRERGFLAGNLISDLSVYCNDGGKNSAETRKHFHRYSLSTTRRPKAIPAI